MKKFITLTIIIFIITNLCGCKKQVIEYTGNNESQKYNLKFSGSMTVGYNCSETVDLFSTAKACKTTDIFEIEEVEILGEEHIPPTKVGTAGGEFFAIVQGEESDTLYNISEPGKIELYNADSITPIFEKDGNFIFGAYENDSCNYNILSYNPKEKSVKRLFELYDDIFTYFTFAEAGDYISVTQCPSGSLDETNDYNEQLKTTHYSTNSKNVIFESNVTFSASTTDFVKTKNISNNYFMSFDSATSKIIVKTIETNEIVSEIYLDVSNKNDYLKLKFFGSKLLIRDNNGLKMHDFEDNTDHMICLLKQEGKNDNEIESFGIICEMIGDVLVFSDTENLLAYDFKNERVATICPLEDVSYTASDNKTTFVYCNAQASPEGFESVLKLKLK